MSLEINPDGTDPLAKLAALTALEACGYLADPRSAPAPVVGYAKGFARAVVSIAKTLRALRTSDPAVVHNALSRLAREGLMPGDLGDATSTAYLFQGKNGITAEPNPRGRIACARAAGFDVRTVAIHKNDVISLNGDGDVDTADTELSPDGRPTRWEHIKGVMIHVDDLRTGARRSLWVSAAEIATRKEQASGQGAWNKDAVSMACTKAIKIAIARGAIPQASLIPAILAACAAHPAPARPLAIEATPRQIAEAPPRPTPAPPTQPEPEYEYDIDPDVDPADAPADAPTDPKPSDDEPLQPPWVVPAITWDSIAARIFTDRDWVGVNPDDLHAAITSAIAEAQSKSQAAGRTLTPEAASRPATLARLVEITSEHLKAM
jgi:hypothetical protein